jgi:hypothetical protein
MELKKELEKLMSYFGTDTPKFKEQYTFIRENFKSESEILQMNELIDDAIAASMENGKKTMNEIRFRVFLIENREIIPVAYIARNYFKKSKNWMYQRINGNTVNGKPAKFTSSEIETFNFALQEIGNKLGSIASV